MVTTYYVTMEMQLNDAKQVMLRFDRPRQVKMEQPPGPGSYWVLQWLPCDQEQEQRIEKCIVTLDASGTTRVEDEDGYDWSWHGWCTSYSEGHRPFIWNASLSTEKALARGAEKKQ